MSVRIVALTVGIAGMVAVAARAQDAQDAQDGATEARPGRVPQDAGAGSAPSVGVAVRAGGPGFALTPDRRAVLHLGVDAGAGFDTNPFSVPTEAFADAGFTGDVVARIRPHAEVNYPGRLLAFTGQAVVDYGFMPGVINANTQEFLLYHSLLRGDLEINRGGMFQFALGETFSWNNDPGNVSLGVLFNRIHNELRAGVGFTPGGGALTTRLKYVFGLTKYLDVEGTGGTIADGGLDQMLHSAELRLDYRFLPRTGFFWNVSAGWASYPFDVEQVNPQAFPVSGVIGLKGQVLNKVAGLVSLGYSNPLVFDQTGVVTASIFGLTGQAEVHWQPTLSSRIGGGFQRTFTPAPLYQYLGNNRFYVLANQVLGGRFNLGIHLGYGILEFGEEQSVLTTAQTGRLDGHLDVLASISYFFNDWFSIGITDKLDWRVTNANDVGTGENFGFIRNQTFVLASVSY